MNNIITPIKQLKQDHIGFFTNLKKVQTIKDAFWFFIAIAFILQIVSSLQGTLVYPNTETAGVLWFLGLVIGGVIFSIAISFFNAGLSYLFLRLFQAKGTFQQTYNTLVYAGIPSFFLAALLSIITLILYPLLESSTIGQIIFAIITFCVVILIIIVTIYLTLKGLSIQHDISMGKVALAVYVIPIALFIVIGLIMGFILAAVFFSQMQGITI